jgi:hypothetical protein
MALAKNAAVLDEIQIEKAYKNDRYMKPDTLDLLLNFIRGNDTLRLKVLNEYGVIEKIVFSNSDLSSFSNEHLIQRNKKILLLIEEIYNDDDSKIQVMINKGTFELLLFLSTHNKDEASIDVTKKSLLIFIKFSEFMLSVEKHSDEVEAYLYFFFFFSSCFLFLSVYIYIYL